MIANMSSRVASATPEELAAMQSQSEAQRTYVLQGSQSLKNQVIFSQVCSSHKFSKPASVLGVYVFCHRAVFPLCLMVVPLLLGIPKFFLFELKPIPHILCYPLLGLMPSVVSDDVIFVL